ncbi:hypothetical protein [Streptomonospora salina]|uniref:Uncharacterized protein n=1 Tax=Streptomonospora salina TaxID=104205 RepID=A0A841E723_9ACTN|nr:hypothetical protein [Streptomonospora salina]MBB5998254.1 hypothetical protein [Streptomonospora salina]
MSVPDPYRILLGMLKDRYGHRWSIRRTEHLWIATATDPDADHAPTIIEPDIDAFIDAVENPPARAGRPSLLSASWVTAEYERLGEGAYISRPPST